MKLHLKMLHRASRHVLYEYLHSTVTCYSQPEQRKRGVLQQLQIDPNQVNGLLGMSYNYRI